MWSQKQRYIRTFFTAKLCIIFNKISKWSAFCSSFGLLRPLRWFCCSADNLYCELGTPVEYLKRKRTVLTLSSSLSCENWQLYFFILKLWFWDVTWLFMAIWVLGSGPGFVNRTQSSQVLLIRSDPIRRSKLVWSMYSLEGTADFLYELLKWQGLPRGWEGGVLPYISYIGMCRCEG